MPQEVAVTWPCSRPSPFVAWVMLEGVGSGMMRKLTSLFLVLLIPSAMVAAEGDTAVRYGTGAVYLNGAACDLVGSDQRRGDPNQGHGRRQPECSGIQRGDPIEYHRTVSKRRAGT